MEWTALGPSSLLPLIKLPRIPVDVLGRPTSLASAVFGSYRDLSLLPGYFGRGALLL